MIISNMALALLVTITAEFFTAVVLGYNKKLQLLVITLINVITNPALNFILMLANQTGLSGSKLFIILPMEVAVILIEWRIMEYAFAVKSKKILCLSAVMNAVSYFTGVLIWGFS